MGDFLVKDLLGNIGWFDGFFIFIIIYSTVQCFVKGFTFSFISFMKWILALILTIILVPKLLLIYKPFGKEVEKIIK